MGKSKQSVKQKKKRKKKRSSFKNGIIYSLLAVIMCAIFGTSVFIGTVIGNKLNLIKIDSDESGTKRYNNESFFDNEGNLNFEPVHDVTDAASLNDWLKKWAENKGEKLHNKNVINCLLCGIDSEDGTIDGGRADAVILLSLNKRKDTITLLSLMRDSYTHIDLGGNDRFYKVNAAYSLGGPTTLVKTIENNYKIKIDKYICVDFSTFPKIIDALGGITLEVKQYEAKFINRTTRHTVKFGKDVTLNGNEALVLSRIRYCDSDGDISRTARQRRIIEAILNKSRNASAGQINNVLNNLLPFVRTNYTKTQILSLSTQALMYNWMDYKIEEMLSPVVSFDSGETITGKDSYISISSRTNKEFVWIVDYQLEAQRVQLALYDTSNIVLHSDRCSPFDFMTLIG
ncbi:MAG: LCP family protein [Clostridiales bacterium]|jgi:LCP family protein required for cell wall assembly|nr:LCP family protein [Clostridiales bacterium]